MARTPNYNLELIDFNKIPWHTKEHDNWRSIDAVFANFITINNMQGVWLNATAIAVDTRYVDPELGTIWTAVIAHTSASTGLFAADRVTNPTYWDLFSDVALAESWASSLAGLVNSVDYSSKAYAVGTVTQLPDGSAKRWAVEVEDTVVIAGSYSALHHATKAAASAVLTAADVISTAADLVATNQDTIDTAADLVLTNADVVLTHADVVLTHADEVLTRADTVLTAAYAVKTDGVASGSDHSSKAWAVGGTGVTDTSGKGASKEWATETSGTVDGTSYSAKEYAAGTQGSTGGSAKDWAQDANQVNGASTNDRSAKAWAQGASMTGSTLGGSSKDWAQVTGGTVDGSDYSAKEYSIGTTATSAKTYATKINGAVTGSDFSSKAWAIGGTNVTSTGSRGAAKEWATTTGAAVDTSEFSSKEYALGTTLTTGSSKQWALGGGSSFTEGTAVAGGVFSAKKYAANAAASASVAASGQIYSTVVNQTGASLSPALSADGTYYLCDTSSNNITVTLPAIGTSEGVKYAFQKTSASNSLIFARSGSDTLNGSASNITITDVNAQIQFVSDDNSPDNWVGVNLSQITVGTGLTKTGSVVAIDQTHLKQTIAIACGDEVTATAAGTAVVTFHMPYAFTLTGVKAGVTTAPAGSVLTVDINEAGSTVLTTKLTIDAGEKTSGTAATAPVIGGAGPALADNALMTIDVDGVGSSTAGAGLKVYLIGYAT